MNRNNLLALALVAGLSSVPATAANMIINNVDAPGVGFNDPAPASPVGGNAGTTIGGQRLIAYARALELWGRTLQSDVTIVVQGSFAGLSCTAAGGTLAQAGAIQIFADFPNAPLANHWYGAALANSLAGQDLAPGPKDPGPLAPPFADDIVANFNGNVGKPGCIEGPGWYYGLDNNPGPGQIDFLDTFMHEVAHGLGFQNFVNEQTGLRAGDTTANPTAGLPDVYMANTLDLNLGRQWNTFTAAEIRASAVRNGRIVWTGAEVSENATEVLGPYEGIRLTGNVNREVAFGASAFGPAPTAANFGGDIALGSDGVAAPGGGTATDGCEPITGAVAGKIALVDRGFCTFVVKVKNAQNAGAIGVILANTLGRAEFEPGGSDPTITIPSIGIAQADGDAIKPALPGVSVGFFIDPTRTAGIAEGYVRLYAPTIVALGSSISHFDTVAAPNLLMEPSITDTLRSSQNLDLTPSLMQDIGWRIETLKIGACDTGVPSVLPNGDMLHASVDQCSASARNRGQFVSCLNTVTNAAKEAGYLTGRQHAAITSCAARR
jgi:hypothetical protein